jgi:hypothetical protein
MRQNPGRKKPRKDIAEVNARDIAKLEQLFRLEELVLRGEQSNEKLAIRLGIPVQIVEQDMVVIRARWQTRTGTLEQKRAESIAWAEAAALNVWNQWEVSKQNQETITTAYEDRLCKDCKGTGWEDGKEASGKWCMTCKGDGFKTVEVVTRKVTGQAGDPSLLREYREFKRLAGYYRGIDAKLKKKEGNQGQNNVVVVPTMNFSGAGDDELLEAKKMLLKLAGGTAGKVTDVEVNKEHDRTGTGE